MAFATPIPLARAPVQTASCAPQRSVIRAAKHVQFKGAKKADRRRPKKHRPSDINRAKPKFEVEPLRVDGLPAVYEIFKPDGVDAAFAGTQILIDEAMVEQYEASLATPEPETKTAPEAKAEPEPVAEAE